MQLDTAFIAKILETRKEKIVNEVELIMEVLLRNQPLRDKVLKECEAINDSVGNGRSG